MAVEAKYDERLLLPQGLVARAFGISPQAFAKWAVEPVRRSGRERLYYLPDIIAWFKERELKSTEDYDLTKERARLTHLQADKTEIEVELLKGNVIEGEVVERIWGAQIGACRAKILGLPTRLGPQVVGVDVAEATRLLRDVCYEALDELKDYEPGQYRSAGDKSKSGGADGAAAGLDDKRTRGRTPKAKSRSKRGARKVADSKG